LILPNGARINAVNQFGLDRHQRIACPRAADHFRAQFGSVRKISASLVIKKLPEAADVLFQLPHDQVASVSRQVFLRRRVLRVEQFCGTIGLEQRPIGYFSVLVAITEQEFTQRGKVRVFQLSAWPLQLLLPIDLRLADAIRETERFIPVEIAGAKRDDLLECFTPVLIPGPLDKPIELVRLRKKHYHRMRLASIAAPSPI